MSYIVSTSILGIQTFVTRFDPSVQLQGPSGGRDGLLCVLDVLVVPGRGQSSKALLEFLSPRRKVSRQEGTKDTRLRSEKSAERRECRLPPPVP